MTLTAGPLPPVSPPTARERRAARRVGMLGNRRKGRVHPLRAVLPVAGALLIMVAWGTVARNSGSGWVQALGAALAGVLLTGMVWPALALRRARVHCTGCPTDGSAGLPVEIMVGASARVRVEPLEPSGPETFVGPGNRSQRGEAGIVTLVPGGRGIHPSIVVELATAAPFGLLWWARTVRVPLPTDLHIGPRPGTALALPPRHDERAGESSRRIPTVVGEPRGVRPYRPGDSRRWVHWPATAHSGELMVREMEGPTAEPILVNVILPSSPVVAEQLAGRAYATVQELLDRGSPVLLGTVEVNGPCLARVADRRAASRRLARAVNGSGPGPGEITVETTGPDR